MLQQKHNSRDLTDRKWKASAVVGPFHQSRSDLFRSATPDWRLCFHLRKLLWFLMLIWQFLLNPLPSKHGFCQTKRNESCQCGVKIICLCSVIARFFWMSRGCGSWFTVCPSRWLQTTELKCEELKSGVQVQCPSRETLRAKYLTWWGYKNGVRTQVSPADCSWLLSNGGRQPREKKLEC